MIELRFFRWGKEFSFRVVANSCEEDIGTIEFDEKNQEYVLVPEEGVIFRESVLMEILQFIQKANDRIKLTSKVTA